MDFNLSMLDPVEQARIEAERARLAEEQLRLDAAKSCEELYLEIRQLYAQTYSSRPGYWDNPVNHTILLASTVISPAYYGLIYTGAMDYKQGLDAETRRERLNTLRQYSAGMRCFSG